MTDLGSTSTDTVIDGLPRRHPAPEVLELVELVLDGVLRADGTVTSMLELPHAAAATPEGGGGFVFEDAEGTPVAAYDPTGSPQLTPVRPFTHGPLRRHRLSRRDVATLLHGAGAVGALVQGPITPGEVDTVVACAREHGESLIWFVVTGTHRSGELAPAALLRAVRRIAGTTDLPSLVVPVAVPHQPDPEVDRALLDEMARGYGAVEVIHTGEALGGALGDELDSASHPAFARELAREYHPAHTRGVTLFFTGLSGSGKSTIAKALAERIADDTSRTVSLLDGDEVRRLLSAGLTFSREDRDLNIRRIGYVATEVTRHGGVAVCAPIAPFAAVREEVRRAVRAVGDFLLVHVATPLEECERRDRKGLYAKARRGEIAEFTGISSPYEIPDDADLRIDTTGRDLDGCVDEVWQLLVKHGYLA